jgi:type VI secretion system protein ImpA
MIIDFDALLKPIDGDSPQGIDLSLTPTYDSIREAIRADNPILYELSLQDQIKKPKWDDAANLCYTALLNQTKDWQLAFWLCEAVGEMNKLEGLERSLEFLYQFGQLFWNSSFPIDPTHRCHLLSSFERKLIKLLYQIPLTKPQTLTLRPFNMQDWMNVENMERSFQKDNRLKEQAIGNGTPILDNFQMAFKDTSNTVLTNHIKLIQSCAKNLKLLCGFLDECELDAFDQPSFKEVFDILNSMEQLVSNYIYNDNLKIPNNDDINPVLVNVVPIQEHLITMESNVMEIQSTSSSNPNTSPTRKEVYNQIRYLSKILYELEPHSPTPHILGRIGEWEQKNLGQILESLSQDPNDFPILLRILGIAV